MAVPPRAAALDLDELEAFDDEGLRTFLDPADDGIDPQLLGRALQGRRKLARRARSALPLHAAVAFDTALQSPVDDASRHAAIRSLVEQLFWPLLYWNHADEYCELIDGEDIEPALIDSLELRGRSVCDIGAGGGRFTFEACARGAGVTAVDAVPALIGRLSRELQRRGMHDVEVRRGSFRALPLDDASVDVAVACSSFVESGAHGGEIALREAERVTKPGGTVAVVWPQDPAWLLSRGYTLVEVDGDPVRHFRDLPTALRLSENFYGDSAAAWVREHASPDVPYAVLGMRPPTVACVRRAGVTPSR